MIIPNKYIQNINFYKINYSFKKFSKFKDRVFKLDWNESTIPPSKQVIKEINQFLGKKNNLNWYPDPISRDLKKAIAKYVFLSEDNLLTTNGSYSAHELICNAYLEKDDEIIVPIPTYSNFLNLPKIHGAKVIKVLYNVGQNCDINQIINKINQKTKIIYLVNPYICSYTFDEIKKIVAIAKNSLVIIDEAYYEFYGKSCVKLIKEFDNLIITRSFSKALSLAGLRLGYILGNEKIIKDLSKIHDFKSVNILAQIAGEVTLKNIRFVKSYVKEINQSIGLLLKELTKMDFEVIQTHAGFILFKHRLIEKEEVRHKLEKKGIFARDLGVVEDQTKEYLRMNIGNLAQTKYLIKLMKKIFL